MLNGKDFVHALEAEPAFAIEEIGDMGLFESGLLGEPESCEFAAIDPFPEDFAEIVLQHSEFHSSESIALYSKMLIEKFSTALIGISTLTAKITSYTIPSRI